MPRRARKRSESGLYHVMLRGGNRQRIFHDETDYRIFLEGLRKYRDLCGFTLHAYCLLPNHVHLLIRENPSGETVSQVMKRLGVWYVARYNRRYERSGGLFEDRFRSEAVDSDAYFTTVIRYIHRNPVKAGIVDEPGRYPYSSYLEYVAPRPDALTDTSLLLAFIPRDEIPAWHAQDDGVSILDVPERARPSLLSDEKALQVMRKASGAANAEAFSRLDERAMVRALKRMREAGATLRQMVRLSGVSLAMVRKYVAGET